MNLARATATARRYVARTNEGDHYAPHTWSNDRAAPKGGSYTRVGSTRRFGVEIETADCSGHTRLYGCAGWGAKTDCSVGGLEFVSPPLAGDSGLDAIDALTHRMRGWKVDNRCGYHLHIDMGGEDDETCRAVCYAYAKTEGVWEGLVAPHRRRGNSYTGPLDWGVSELDNYDDFARFAGFRRTRYVWFNVSAYNRHKTFEVRSHEGTLDGYAVKMWVKAHLRFADWAARIGREALAEKFDGKSDAEKFDIVAREAWADSKLEAYYRKKRGW